MEKVNTFYQEKKAEAMRKFNTLKEQLSVTEEPNMRNNQVKKTEKKYRAVDRKWRSFQNGVKHL